MIIKNTAEEMVIHAVDEMIKDLKDPAWQNSIYRNDLICYVLNRVKPMYVTSSRGVIHQEIDSEKDVQKQVDLFSLIAEGVRVIGSRRKDENEKEDFHEFESTTEQFYYNFPYFIGKVISTINWDGIPDVVVTLKHRIENDFVNTEMINAQWTNPHIISERTKGYYTFFPKPLEDQNKDSTSQTFEFKILYEHPRFELIERYFHLDITSEKMIYHVFRKGNSHRLEDVFINIAYEK